MVNTFIMEVNTLNDNVLLKCRSCLNERKKFQSIFSKHKNFTVPYSYMLSYCTTVEVTENDQLPSGICQECATKLRSFYKFKQKCIESKEILEQLLLPKVAQEVCNKVKQQDYDSQLPSDDYFIDETYNSLNDSVNTGNFSDVIKETEITENPVKKVIKNVSKQHRKQIKCYQCDVCGKILSCRSGLVQHMRRHTGEKPYSCDICDKRFGRTEHVIIHRRIHTGERPHTCSVCGKTFVQYASLSAHLRTHTGEKPHICSVCGKAFAQSVTLTYHMRSHTGETPYVCKICGKGFTHSGNLNIHLRFHSGERPFCCTLCGKRFVTSSHLTVHIKQHTGDKAHGCSICGKAFIRREHLKDHMVTHTGQKPHACQLCPKRYTQRSHLTRHMKTHKLLQ